MSPSPCRFFVLRNIFGILVRLVAHHGDRDLKAGPTTALLR
jgi:hypothetical protein